MRIHHYLIALIIVLAGHALALVGMTFFSNAPPIPVAPPVLQAALITPPPAAVEKPAPDIPPPPKPPEPKKEPPIEKKKPDLKPPPAPKPKPVLSVDKPAAPTANTVATPPPPPPKVEAPPPEPVVLPPRIDAQKKDNPPPDYPSAARRMGQQGTVILEVLILANGSVGDVKLKTSSGFSRLDDAATEAVKKWHYIPAMRGDKAIEYWYTQPVKFVLD